MALLTKVERNGTHAAGAAPVNITMEVWRLGIVLFLGTLALLGAFTLYFVDKGDAASGFLAIGEALVIGGLGISAGERIGAIEGSEKAL